MGRTCRGDVKLRREAAAAPARGAPGSRAAPLAGGGVECQYSTQAMLAYVFWHWKRTQISEQDYEARQRSFHAALSATPPDGFIRSASAAVAGAAWAAEGSAAYEDWYFVQDYTALGT
jgi:hypothetical protein